MTEKQVFLVCEWRWEVKVNEMKNSKLNNAGQQSSWANVFVGNIPQIIWAPLSRALLKTFSLYFLLSNLFGHTIYKQVEESNNLFKDIFWVTLWYPSHF